MNSAGSLSTSARGGAQAKNPPGLPAQATESSSVWGEALCNLSIGGLSERGQPGLGQGTVGPFANYY